MPARYATTPSLKRLFSNLPIETGLCDAKIVRSIHPSIPHKTFSRLRINPPASVTAEQVLFVARFAERFAGVEAARVIAHVRDPARELPSRMENATVATTFGDSVKDRVRANQFCDRLITSCRHVRLFDRSDSFAYLAPAADEAAYCANTQFGASGDTAKEFTAPLVSVLLTLESLSVRREMRGDEGIEAIIDHTDSNQHLLQVIDDSGRNHGRTHRGVFEDATAIVIFDDSAMFVLPNNRKALRFYESAGNPKHARLIRESIRHFARIQRLVAKPLEASTNLLRSYLSYRLPWQST